MAPRTGIWRPFGALDTCKHKIDCGVPDLQVLTLLVSLGFDTMEEEKKAQGKPEKTSTTLVAHISIVCAGCCSTTGYFLQVFVFPNTLQALLSAHPPVLQNPVTVLCTHVMWWRAIFFYIFFPSQPSQN